MTNSTFGRTNMEVKDFTAKDICAIIKQCGESGVSNLQIGTFSVVFEREASAELNPPEQASQVFPAVPLEQIEDIQELGNLKDRVEDANLEIDNLLITNPEEYEEALARGDFEHATDERS